MCRPLGGPELDPNAFEVRGNEKAACSALENRTIGLETVSVCSGLDGGHVLSRAQGALGVPLHGLSHLDRVGDEGVGVGGRYEVSHPILAFRVAPDGEDHYGA